MLEDLLKKLEDAAKQLELEVRLYSDSFQLGDGQRIVEQIATYFGVSIDNLRESRRRSVVHAKQVAMYVLYEHERLSYTQIADLVGVKDHTTVMHGVARIADGRKQNREVDYEVRSLLDYLQLTAPI